MHQTPFLSADNVVLTLLQDFFAFRVNGGCIGLRESVGQNLHNAPCHLEETKQERNPHGKNGNFTSDPAGRKARWK